MWFAISHCLSYALNIGSLQCLFVVTGKLFKHLFLFYKCEVPFSSRGRPSNTPNINSLLINSF